MRIHPRVWLFVRLLLSGLLLWLAFAPIDWQSLAAASAQLQPQWLFLAWLLVIASNTLAALRWGWIMRGSGLKLNLARCISLYFAAGLINQGVPSTLGGDTYRAVQATRGRRIGDGPALRYGLLAVALDRGMGLAGNVTLGALGLVLGGAVIGAWAGAVGLTILLAVLLGMLLIGALLPLPAVERTIGRVLQAVHLPFALGALRSVFAWPVNIVQLVMALLIHLLTLATFWSCLMAYGVDVPIQALMVGLPALGLLLMLPISIAGWGLRETTLSAVLLLWAVPSSMTVLASITYGLIVVLAYLPATLTLVRTKSPI